MAGVRETSRARTTAAILAAAREQIATVGGVGLSMRAVARDVGLVSSAIYRYYPTRESLITAMILDSYGHLDDALAAAALSDQAASSRRWTALALAFREWARSVPNEFQLIYGTPIPGYVAPPETVPAAGTVASHFLQVGAVGELPAFGSRALAGQLSSIASTIPGATPSGFAAVLTELAALVGFISVELAGHFVGSADPGDELFKALVARQTRTLDLH